VIARTKGLDTPSDFFYDAGPLVAATVGKMSDLSVGLGDVLVGVAEAGGGQPNEDLMILRSVEIDLDDLPLSGLLHQQRRLGLHE
jgi:hypothetical protein